MTKKEGKFYFFYLLALEKLQKIIYNVKGRLCERAFLRWRTKVQRKSETKGTIMNYSAFDGKKLMVNLARFALYMVLFIVTPFLARLTSPCFVQISYDQLTPFFVDIVCTLMWLIEIGLIALVERIIKRKTKTTAPAEGKKKKQKKEISVLPLKNVLVISGIIIGCLVVVGLQIGLEVKPFYDMAYRVTSAYAYLNNLGPIIMALAKCLWIILILKAALAMGEAAFGVIDAKGLQTFLVWAFATLVLFLFGLYDIIFFANKYALTYALFYVLFPLLYALAKKSGGKYYLIILFIYIF